MFRNIPVKDAAATAEGASQNLLRELPFTIDFYNRSSQGSELKAETPVYLSGELALDPELAAQVAQVSGREVMALDPPVECPESFPVEQYLATVGLMLRERW